MAVTAFNILAQKPVTLADERRKEFDRPHMTPRKRVSASLTRFHAQTDQQRETAANDVMSLFPPLADYRDRFTTATMRNVQST